MRFTILLLILCALGLTCPQAPLAADPAGPGSAPLAIRPGRTSVNLDPAGLSFLPVDSSALRLNLCSGHLTATDSGTISPRGECDLVVAPPPGIDFFVDGFTPDGSSSRVSVQPTGSSSWPANSPVDTPCGLWAVSMELDPGAAQPVSGLVLERSGSDPSQGVFASVVKLAVRYRFVNSAKGISYELPAVVPLELSGHWAAVPEDGPGLEDGASNLVLFVTVSRGQWTGAPACGSWARGQCPVCATVSPDLLERVNPPGPRN